MNVTNSMVQKVGEIFLTSKKRRDAGYANFLEFYRKVIEETDGAVAAAIGNIPVKVTRGKEDLAWGIILTASDYLFWKYNLTEGGVRFKISVEIVKTDMLMALAKQTENNCLTADERKSLIALLDN